MRRHDQVFVFLDFITYLKKVKNLIDLFKYFLVGGKQGIVCIDLGGRFIEISGTNETVSSIFLIVLTFYDTNFRVDF